ncbi:MAG: acyl-CoA thioesterase [Desulfobacterales bacterium]|nr:MAG: acyl-CoA thioesterase [Desulfobacterales bacterium]
MNHPLRRTTTIMSHVMLPEDANPSGNIHGGVVMKHIDNAAGVTAMRHSRSNVVTASIERLDFHYPMYIGDLIVLKASLNAVSRTSMEVGVRVEAEDLMTGEIRHTASAYLTFVSLDETGRPRLLPPYEPETEEECRRHRAALKRMRIHKKKRLRRANSSGAPSSDTSGLISGDHEKSG